jgi:hypothetical protein
VKFEVTGPKIPEPIKDSTKLEIITLIDTHQTVQIDIHVDAPRLIFPTKIPIEIVLGTVEVHAIYPPRKRVPNDASSYYDQYHISITGFQILIGETYLCQPVSASIDYFGSFVRMSALPMTKIVFEVDTISVQTNRVQYMTFLVLGDLLSTTGKSTAAGPSTESNWSIDVFPLICTRCF